jgi:hypothetical protein
MPQQEGREERRQHPRGKRQTEYRRGEGRESRHRKEG